MEDGDPEVAVVLGVEGGGLRPRGWWPRRKTSVAMMQNKRGLERIPALLQAAADVAAQLDLTES